MVLHKEHKGFVYIVSRNFVNFVVKIKIQFIAVLICVFVAKRKLLSTTQIWGAYSGITKIERGQSVDKPINKNQRKLTQK